MSQANKNLIVLAGAGYANLEILRQHIRSPFHNSEVVLITPRPTKLIRNMLPWVISGEVRRSQAEIDLLKLCKVAGAQLLLGELDRIDLVNKAVVLKQGGNVYFDYLSVSIGTEMNTELQGDNVVYGNRLEFLLDRFEQLFGKDATPKIAISGNSPLSRLLIRGIARLRAPVELTLINASESYLTAALPSLEKLRMNRLLTKLKANILNNRSITKCSKNKIVLENGEEIDNDILILADEGKLSSIFAHSAFPLEEGKILVNDALQLINSKTVFVAGPGVTIQGHLIEFNPHRPSHRFGKVIAENIRRDMRKKPLIVFRSEHSFASWLPIMPERVSLSVSKVRSDRIKGWLSRKKHRSISTYISPSPGEVVRSNQKNTSVSLIGAHARMEGFDAQWISQVMGRQILNQCLLKNVGEPVALQAHLSLKSNQPRKLSRTKISQVQAGLESLQSGSLEVHVSSGQEELLHVNSELFYKPNLKLKAGDLIYLLGRLGTVQSLFHAYEESTNGEAWFQLRSQFNQDLREVIESAVKLGVTDGQALDERGFIRNLEDLVVPTNLGVSLDLDRIPLHFVNQLPAIDRNSPHIQRNIEYSNYLPEDLESLTHHPRFLALFGAEISGLILIVPQEISKSAISTLTKQFENLTLTPVGALTDGPVHFRFRLTTK